MKLVLSCLALAGILATAPAVAADNLDYTAFTAACKTNADYLDAATAYYDGPQQGVEQYCGCIVEQLGTAPSQSDIDMLTGDLANTNTDAQRMAYETYEDLNAFYAPTASDCLIIAGLADGYDPSVNED